MRPYAGESDLQSITDLLNHCDAVGQLDDNYAVEDLRLEFSDPRLDPQRDLRLWEDDQGQLIGFGQIWMPEEGEVVDGYLYWRIHPGARGNGLEDELFSWGLERVREVARERGKPAKLLSSAREHDTYSRGVIEQHGLTTVRYFFQMTRPLGAPIETAQFPEGFMLRQVVDDADVAAWVESYNLSFIDHWNHHPATVEAHKHWLSHASYRPEHDLIVIAPDGKVAAFCFCVLDEADNARNQRNEGWIGTLGTRRGYRKIGLGRAMLLSGLHALKASGVDVAKLGVDAENPTGALRLYESVGFRQVFTRIAYGIDLA
jgi:mycothiol synthase